MERYSPASMPILEPSVGTALTASYEKLTVSFMAHCSTAIRQVSIFVVLAG